METEEARGDFHWLKPRNVVGKWIFKIGVSGFGLDSCGSGEEPVAGSCKYGSQDVPIEAGNFVNFFTSFPCNLTIDFLFSLC